MVFVFYLQDKKRSLYIRLESIKNVLKWLKLIYFSEHFEGLTFSFHLLHNFRLVVQSTINSYIILVLIPRHWNMQQRRQGY